jgi:hypothetical protein
MQLPYESRRSQTGHASIMVTAVTGQGGTFSHTTTVSVTVQWMEGTTMIESFLYGAWIGGQALYWLFLRHRTEFLGEEYWRTFLLISRNRTTEDITR